MKKSILISYQAMMIGGSTTSLLGLLSSLDFDKYEVDLLLNTNTGEYLDKVPQQVHLLQPAFKYPNHRVRQFYSLLSPKFLRTYIKSKKIVKATGIGMHGVQYLESQDVIKFRKIKKNYDIAIAFLEGINCKFVAKHIKAKKKIAWIHIDYEASKFNPEYDIEAMEKFDHIVTVSSICNKAFCKNFPTLTNQVHTIENIISLSHIKTLSKEPIDFEINHKYFNLVTTCRIEFCAKALDRAVKVWGSLSRRDLLNNLRWYIVGDGIDYLNLQRLIKQENLEDRIILLGKRINPYPYLRLMDLFFLPSRWEGKPMAVTEALMLKLPAIVTNYASATEQITNHFNGLVVDNSEEGIEFGLNYISNNQDEIKKWKANINPEDYIDDKAIKQIYSLIEF